MNQFTRLEILQIRQEIKALENEKKMARGGLRVSQTDRQIATNEIATKYGMAGVKLARMITPVRRNWRAEKDARAVAAAAANAAINVIDVIDVSKADETVATESLLEQLNQKKSEQEARQAEIAELEKAMAAAAAAELEELKKATAAKDECFKGKYVYVYEHDNNKSRNLVFRIVSRGRDQIHVCYFDDAEKANKVARNIDKVVLRAIEKLAGDA